MFVNEQMPLFMHGLILQAVYWHIGPLNLLGHKQIPTVFPTLMHVPLFMHGFGLQTKS